MKIIIVAVLLFALFYPRIVEEQKVPEWCLHSQYQTLIEYETHAPVAENTFIKIHQTHIEVFVPCTPSWNIP